MAKHNRNTAIPHDKGGIDLIISHLNKIGIWDKFSCLGQRNPRAEYSNTDVIQTWIMNVLCGSKRLEHAYLNKDKLRNHPKFGKGMSPDTISRVFRSLAVEDNYYGYYKTSKQSEEEQLTNRNQVNLNHKLNELVLDLAIEFGLLKKGMAYELDIDATVVKTKVYDSRISYNSKKGYCPMVVVFG